MYVYHPHAFELHQYVRRPWKPARTGRTVQPISRGTHTGLKKAVMVAFVIKSQKETNKNLSSQSKLIRNSDYVGIIAYLREVWI